MDFMAGKIDQFETISKCRIAKETITLTISSLRIIFKITEVPDKGQSLSEFHYFSPSGLLPEFGIVRKQRNNSVFNLGLHQQDE